MHCIHDVRPTSVPRRPICLAVLSGLLLTSIGQAGPEPAPHVAAKLVSVEEVRRAQLVAQYSDQTSMDLNPSRLEMTFALELPEGAMIASIDQPTSIRAIDSTGKDLAATGSGEGAASPFVWLIQAWNKPAREVGLKLALPARGARSVSLDTRFDVWVFDELQELAFDVPSKPLSLTIKKLDNLKVTAELKEAADTAQLTITPGSVKRYIESVKFAGAGASLESQGAMWDDRSVTYFFPAMPSRDMEVKLTVRRALRSLPCHIQLADRLLP